MRTSRTMVSLFEIAPTISSTLSEIANQTKCNFTSLGCHEIATKLTLLQNAMFHQDVTTLLPTSEGFHEPLNNSYSNINLHDGSGLGQITLNILIAVLALLVVSALAGNFVLVAVIISVRKLHSKSNTFIVDLAVSDILIAITVIPIDIERLLRDGFHHDVTTCEFVSTLFFMSLPASAISLSLLTLERYITLKYPLTRFKILTRKRAIAALIIKWVYVIFIASLPAMGWVYQPTTVTDNCNMYFTLEFAVFMVVVNFILPLCIILFANFEIFRIANRAARKMRQSTCRSERRRASLIAVGSNVKAAKRIMLLVGVMLLSWLPYITNVIVNITCQTCYSSARSWILLSLNYSNGSINPILYGLLNREVRKEIQKMFREVSRKCTKNRFDKPFQNTNGTECMRSVSMATERAMLNTKESPQETQL